MGSGRRHRLAVQILRVFRRDSGYLWSAVVVIGGLVLLAFVAGAAASEVRAADPRLVVTPSTHVVEWDTGDGSTGQVYVSVDGGPEDFVAEGASGSADVSWVAADKHYAFALYAARDHSLLLASFSLGSETQPATTTPTVRAPASLTSRVIDRLLGLQLVPLTIALVALLARGRVVRAAAVVALVWALFPVGSVPSVPLPNQPFPDAGEYADSANQLAHGNGFVTAVHGCCREDISGLQPPRYPPGFPLVMAAFAEFSNYPANVQMGARMLAMLYVLVTVGVAWRLGGATAAALTALFVGSSPFAAVSGSFVLSDAFAAGLTALLLILVRSRSAKTAALAGAGAGLLTTIRLSSGLAIPALLIGLRGRARWVMIASAAPFLLALGLYQWLTFGSPFRTGYDFWLPGAKFFDPVSATTFRAFGDGPWVVPDQLGGALMRWVCPCADGGPMATAPDVLLYPAVLLGLFWTFAPPFVGLVGIAYLWSRRRDPESQFILALTVLTLAFYCVYFYQAARFMAAPATLLVISGGVAVAVWAVPPLALLRDASLARVRGRWRSHAGSRRATDRRGSRSVPANSHSSTARSRTES
jgi:hypothetical protein